MTLFSELTTFRIGGPCENLYEPDGLERAIALLEKTEDPIIIGGGSNILAADEGVSDPVVRTTRLDHIRFSGRTVRAGCGAGLPELSRAAAKRGLSGLEWASGIPGTVGGALVMNAGAYGGEMSQTVTEALVFNGAGTVTVRDFGFAYRHSVFHLNRRWTALEVTFELIEDDPVSIAARMDELRKRRGDKQPLTLPSAGSFFKRPPGGYASELIERCGLKGLSVGGARVSEKHSGFIVNTGGATCDDVLRLSSRIRETVLSRTGVELEPEVRLLGRDWI
jgi:UDP-N-acetylmuramate dehydrogenase